MSLKRFPKNDYVLKSSSYLQEKEGVELTHPELKPHSSLNYSAPGVIPPRKGRNLVVMAILAAVSYGSYSVWNTFFRYESYGVVSANVVGVFAPSDGQIQSLNVVEGDIVKKGSSVAKIINTNDQRDLLKIEDEIETTQSEILSKESETRWSHGKNNDLYYDALSELLTEEGQLSELKSKLIMMKSSLNRTRSLKSQGASSQLDLDKALSDYTGTSALIVSKTRTIETLKNRVALLRSTSSDTGVSQNIPLQKKLNFLKNEKKRMEEKIAEGNLVSPVDGIVSAIHLYEGERVHSDRIFLIVQDNTTKLVLYYSPATKVPKVGETVNVWSPSLNKTVKTVVTAVSKDTVDPPSQIKKNYSADDQLIRVYLQPIGEDINSFIVGSMIKRPNVFETLTEFVKVTQSLFLGDDANAHGDNQ